MDCVGVAKISLFSSLKTTFLLCKFEQFIKDLSLSLYRIARYCINIYAIQEVS